MTLYLAAFAMPSEHSHHHHDHNEEGCCGGHHTEEETEKHECCGGHHPEEETEKHECCGGHHTEEEHECCGGHGHEGEKSHEGCCDKHQEQEEPETGFKVFAKTVEELYPDYLPLFDGFWLINSEKTHQEIYQALKHTLDSHSALWILPAPTESAGFLKPDALEWIKPRLYPNKK